MSKQSTTRPAPIRSGVLSVVAANRLGRPDLANETVTFETESTNEQMAMNVCHGGDHLGDHISLSEDGIIVK